MSESSQITLSRQELLIHLKDLIRSEGNATQKEWAEKNGFSSSYISQVLTADKNPSKRLLEILGFKAETKRVYVKI